MGISQANFKSGPFALTVSWLLDSYVRGRARKPILLKDRALLLGLRLQERLQGLGVRLTLAQHDGDDQGNEKQQAGGSQRNPDENLTEEIQLFLLACLCRNKRETRERKGPAGAGGPASKGTRLALREAGRSCR